MDKEVYEKGLKIRKEVVGVDYVEKSLAQANEFTRPLQNFITQYCWGEVWGREEHLDRRSRSILNIGMIIALNRPNELKLHLRGALNNGLTVDEIREMILQAGVYCGAPAALDANRIAVEVIKAYESE